MLEQHIQTLTQEIVALRQSIEQLASVDREFVSPSSNPQPASSPAPTEDGAFSSVEVVEEEFNFDNLVLRAIQWTERHSEAAMAQKLQEMKPGAGKLSDLSLDEQKQLFMELAP